jgi:hypothetical protein
LKKISHVIDYFALVFLLIGITVPRTTRLLQRCFENRNPTQFKLCTRNSTRKPRIRKAFGLLGSRIPKQGRRIF